MVKKQHIFLLLFMLLVIITGCQNNNKSDINENISDEKEWVFLFYMVGDSNLEEYAIQHINEIEKGLTSDKIGVFVFIDRNENYDASNGNWANPRLYKIKFDTNPNIINSELVKELPEADSTNESFMEDVIKEVFDKVQTKRKALVFWGHGDGWRGFGYDDSSNQSYLTMDRLNKAMVSLKKYNISDWDLIFFYSCLMGQLEVQNNFIGMAKYFVGSEDIMYTTSHMFSKLFYDLSNNPSVETKQFLKEISDTYFESMPEQALTREITLSAIDLNKLNSSINLLENLMKDINKDEKSYNLLRDRFRTYEFLGYVDGEDYIDLVDFLNTLSLDNNFESYKDKIIKVKNLFKDAVLISRAGEYQDRARGISVYLPKRLDLYDDNYSNVPLSKENPSWFDSIKLINKMLEKDTSKPIINIIKQTKLSESGEKIEGEIKDENPVELKLTLGSKKEDGSVQIYKIEKIPLNIAEKKGSKHTFSFDFSKDSLYLSNKDKTVKVPFLDVTSGYYYIINAQYQDSDTLNIFDVQLFFSKSYGNYLGIIGKEEFNPFFIVEPKKGDKIIISKYFLNEKTIDLDEDYAETITINDQIELKVTHDYDPSLDQVILFSRDMSNNKIIEKIK